MAGYSDILAVHNDGRGPAADGRPGAVAHALHPHALRPAARAWAPGGAAALLALTLGALPASAEGEAVSDPLEPMQVSVLDNGLTVLTLEDHTTPVVSFQIWVNVGSGDESRWTGIAHLFEHMMFRGSRNLGKEEHARLVGERGGRLNAYTSRDVTVYYEDITPEHLPVVIALEAERFTNLVIDKDSLASEREVVMSERRWRTEDDPDGRAFEQMMALSFLAHPYRVPTVGWMSDLEEVTVEACRRFFDTYYASNNLVVSVAGDFDTQEVLGLVRKHMSGLRPAAEIPRNPQQEPKQLGERRAVVKFDVEGPLLRMAWHAPPTGHEDAEALDVLSLVLSRGRNSRLYRRLVYDEPLALSASASYWELKSAGVFYGAAKVRPGASIDRVEELFMEELQRIKRELPSEEEVERARRAMEVAFSVGQSSAHALASRMGWEWIHHGRVRTIEERIARVRAVTPEEVRRVARLYLPDEGRSVVRVIPDDEESGEPGGAPGAPGSGR